MKIHKHSPSACQCGHQSWPPYKYIHIIYDIHLHIYRCISIDIKIYTSTPGVRQCRLQSWPPYKYIYIIFKIYVYLHIPPKKLLGGGI